MLAQSLPTNRDAAVVTDGLQIKHRVGVLAVQLTAGCPKFYRMLGAYHVRWPIETVLTVVVYLTQYRVALCEWDKRRYLGVGRVCSFTKQCRVSGR